MHRIAAVVCRSLQYGLDHPTEALARVRRFGRGEEGQCTDRFVTMFANQDSLCVPADVRVALVVLFEQLVDIGLAGKVPILDIIEGAAAARRPERACSEWPASGRRAA
jgi:predicted solute-binding protein